MSPRSMAAVILFVSLAASAAAQQEATVRGRVVERGSGEAVPGATVELSGSRQVLTNPNGVFVFPGVKPGRRTLTVNMIGYARSSMPLDVQRDTSLLIELEVEAVRVRDLTVRNRTYSVRGQLKDSASGKPIMDAEIVDNRNRRARSNGMGRYRLSRVAVGEPVVVQVRALGFLPAAAPVDADRDTTVDFLLLPDRVALRMLAVQRERLISRTNALPFSVHQLGRDDMMNRYYNWTVADILKQNMFTMSRQPACIFLDERPLHFSGAELEGYLPDQIERIEIIDRGTMVRVYTRVYMQEMLRKRANPGPIVLIRGGAGPTVCH